MNFLFTTVLVLLLVAPGLFFNKAYFSASFNIKFSRLTITDQVFYALIPTFFIHLLILFCAKTFGWFYFDFSVLGVLLMGAKDDTTIGKAFAALSDNLGRVLFYQFVVISAATLSGWGLRLLIKKYKIDKKVEFFKYDNYWYYLVTGEIIEFHADQTPSVDASQIEFIILDILVASKDKNVLYSGFFYDYQLGPDGGLDCLYLKAAKRKIINTDPKVKESEQPITDQKISFLSKLFPFSKENPQQEAYNEYYPVDGDILVIPYKEIINVNFTYYFAVSSQTTDITAPEVTVDVPL